MRQVDIKMIPTLEEFPEVTDTTSTSPHKLNVYPDTYQAEITGDWYKSQTLPVKALEDFTRVDVVLEYRDILEGDAESNRLFEFSENPEIIWKGEI